jgi:hypothetical protein
MKCAGSITDLEKPRFKGRGYRGVFFKSQQDANWENMKRNWPLKLRDPILRTTYQ